MANDDWRHHLRQGRDSLQQAAHSFNLADALGEYSRQLKRNLVAWSGFLFLCKFYQLKLSKIPWIDVSIPDTRADALVIVVAVPLAYSIVSFTIQAWADLRNWRLGFSGEIARYNANNLHRVAEYLHQIEHILRTSPQLPSTVQDTWNNAVDAVNAATAEHRKLISGARRITTARKIFAYVWEFALPIALGIACAFYARFEIAASARSAFEAL